jgi:hypothetical protein
MDLQLTRVKKVCLTGEISYNIVAKFLKKRFIEQNGYIEWQNNIEITRLRINIVVLTLRNKYSHEIISQRLFL